MRRRIPLILFGSALLVLGAAAGLLGLDRLETPEEEYSTYAEALRGGFAARGWMPDFVPRSATRIRAAHNLDTNLQWLAFELPPKDLARLVSQGKSVVSLPPSHAPFWITWWRSDLEQRKDPSVARVVLPDEPEGSGRQVRCLMADLQERQVFAWACEAETAA